MKNENVKSATSPELVAQSKIEATLAGYSDAERDNFNAILAKYRNGKAPKWQEDKLRAAGLIEPRRVAADAGDDLADATSNTELAARLTRHFAGRIGIDISAPALAQWRRGRGLPLGTPLPPARVNNRHKTRKWADWITRYLLPKYGVSGVEGAQGERSVFQKSAEAKAQRDIDEAAIAKIERRVAEGAYQPVEPIIKHIEFAGTVINQHITALIEKGVADKLIAEADKWNLTAEQKMSLDSAIRTACQNAADGVRAGVQKALLDAVEKTQ